MIDYGKLTRELTIKLEQSGLTFSTEGGDPVVVRPIRAEQLLKPIIAYLEQENYLAQ